MTRSVEELRRDSEQSRAQLAATVDRLREQIADTAEDIRYKVSPENIKAEVSGFISHKTHGWMDALKQQAMDNPMQAIAAGTAIAVPAIRLARGFPLPLLMIGAGLALSSKTVRDRAAEAASPGIEKAREVIDEASELLDENLFPELRSASDGDGWIEVHSFEPFDGIDETLNSLGGEERSRLVGDDCFRRTTATERDDRTPARHGLDRDDAEVLLAGKYQCPATRIVMPENIERL